MSYSVKDIEVLQGLEGVRENVGMYLGSAETQVLHALREITENTLDLFLKGMNDFIGIIVSNSKESFQTYTVIDKGPGIPIEVHPRTGISTLTTVFTSLHAGSNFHKKEEEKAISRGKHGVGSSAVVAVSLSYKVWTCRDKKWFFQEFSKGKAISKVKEVNFPEQFLTFGADSLRGTIIQYNLDYSVMPKTKLSAEELSYWASQMADLNPGVKVRLVYDNKIDETYYNGIGIKKILDDFKNSDLKKASFLQEAFLFESKNLDVALQWSSLEGEHILSYVNGASTPGGGSHVLGVMNVVTSLFKQVKGRGIDFTPSDLREGIVCIVHYFCSDDDYSGQNKEKLNTVSAPQKIADILTAPLQKWMNKNKALVKEILLRASSIKKAKQEAREITKAAVSLKSTPKKGVLIGSKLSMSNKKCPPEERELFLVEGNSAGSCCREARNAYNQEILRCRGKGLNVIRASLAQALKNEEISSLLLALGADAKSIKEGNTVSTFRVGKILLFSDPDVDAPLKGNTRVFSLTGEKTIEELAEEWKKTQQPLKILGRNAEGKIVPVEAFSPSIREVTNSFLRITLKNGASFDCTFKHPWALSKPSNRTVERKGHNFCLAQDLRVGDCLVSTSLEKDSRDSFSVVDIQNIISSSQEKFYCMAVPSTGNFFVSDKLGNGVLSSNCHIDALWLSMLYRFAPEAFKHDMVYKVNVPLYIKNGDYSVYGFSLDEIKAKMKPSEYSKITRCKGLGEFNAEQLAPFMDSETRHLTKITYPEAKAQVEEFLSVMGNDSTTRKKLLGIKNR